MTIFGRIVIAFGAFGGIGTSSDPYRRTFMILIATWGLMIAFEGSVLQELDLIGLRYERKLLYIMAMIYAAPILSTVGVLTWVLFQHVILSWSLTLAGALSIGLFYRFYQSQSKQPATPSSLS